MSESLSISAAIPTLGREKHILDALDTIAACDKKPDSVIIVDQNKSGIKGLGDKIKQHQTLFPIVNIKSEQPNLPRARNIALEACSTDVIAFIDDDCEVSTHFFSQHLESITKAGVSAVAGKITSTLKFKKPRAANWPTELDYYYFDLESERHAENVSTFGGGNHSIYTKLAKEIGGYDENFRGWAFREDSDMSLRLFNAGKKIVYNPDASVIHHSAPQGGCRIHLKGKQQPPYEIMYPECYFIHKHFNDTDWGRRNKSKLLRRKYIFNKYNIFSPHRLYEYHKAYEKIWAELENSTI